MCCCSEEESWPHLSETKCKCMVTLNDCILFQLRKIRFDVTFARIRRIGEDHWRFDSMYRLFQMVFHLPVRMPNGYTLTRYEQKHLHIIVKPTSWGFHVTYVSSGVCIIFNP